MRKITVHIQNLIDRLSREGISFYFDQTTQFLKTNSGIINGTDEYEEKRLENVVFEKDGFEYKIYEGLFFREFGQSHHFVKKGDDFQLEILTDKDFYDNWFGIISYVFKKRNV